jgi:hypothetical protein
MSVHKQGAADTTQHSKDNEFSYFNKPITNLLPSKTVNLKTVYELITSDALKDITLKAKPLVNDKKAYSKYKSQSFDYVTFNGIFSKREDNGLQGPSGYFIIDIDNLPNDKLISLRESLKIDFTLCPQMIFKSSSGNGLKVVVKTDSSLNLNNGKNKMGIIWSAINKYFKSTYQVEIDSSGKDYSRACFICWDSEAWLNENPTVLGKDFIKQKEEVTVFEESKNNKVVSPRTTIHTLANRYLGENNHHPDLVKFVGANVTISTPKETVISYLDKIEKKLLDSAWIEREKRLKEIDNIYESYSTDSSNVIKLSQFEIAVDVFTFTYSSSLSSFDLKGLYYDGILNILQKHGFAKRQVGSKYVFIQKVGSVIEEVNSEKMKEFITRQIDNKGSIQFSYQSIEYEIPNEALKEKLLRGAHNLFNDTWLQHLLVNSDEIVKDTATEMYFCFKNAFVTVRKDGISSVPLDLMGNKCIWKDQIIKRDFEYVQSNTSCHFYTFLSNVCNNHLERLNALRSAIGYLMHHHFRESEGQAVILYDETITDIKKPMGGSGKGLIVNAIKQVRETVKIDGKHLKADDKFRFGNITPSTQIVWLDDVRPDFDFSMLHSCLTDGWTVERKYQIAFTIIPVDSPKTIICSNSIVQGGGTTNKRRQYIIEVGDFYSRQIIIGNEKPIEQTHNGLFFSSDWSIYEWNCFYSVLLDCAQFYLRNGLTRNKGINVELNRLRQSTSEDFFEWAELERFELDFQYNTTVKFNDFIGTYYGPSHHIAQTTFTKWLKAYAEYKGWIHSIKKSNSQGYFKFNSR